MIRKGINVDWMQFGFVREKFDRQILPMLFPSKAKASSEKIKCCT